MTFRHPARRSALLAALCAGLFAASAIAAEPPAVVQSQILLGNAFGLKNGQIYAGSSAFLVSKDGKLFAVTARSVLGAGDIRPEVPPSQLNARLELWAFFVPGTPGFDLHADRLITVSDAVTSQYLVLSLRNPEAAANITPLSLAATLPQRGDTVYMLSCPGTDNSCHQRAYALRLIDYRGQDMLAEPLDPAADMGSFSGAPVIDKDGRVFAIGSGALVTGTWKGKIALVSLQGLAAQ